MKSINFSKLLRTVALVLGFIALAPALANATGGFSYTFNSPGTLYEAASPSLSTSPYLWLASGAKLIIQNGTGQTVSGGLPPSDPWHALYATLAAVSSDTGAHPQNTFSLFSKTPVKNASVSVYAERTADNLANATNRHPYNGESILARYQDENNYYYAGIRADGLAVIKKKVNGTYTTLATKQVFAGAYDPVKTPDLIPKGTWIGLKLDVADNGSGNPVLSFSTDMGNTGSWIKILSATDSANAIPKAGLAGIESDYADAKFDTFNVTENDAASYDETILAAKPALYLTLASPTAGSEKDQSGNNHNGTYNGGAPGTAALPNGDTAADFNGSSEYLTVPSASSLSISATGALTYEAWVRPDTLQFPNGSEDGYVDWIGKCEDYSPNCEWEGRMYSASTPQGRADRISGYVFNPGAGLGSAADWQPQSNVVKAGEWLHVVVEYQTKTTPSGCSGSYPGTINIWVNGVPQSFPDHSPTGCMSQYKTIPKSGNSPLDIGTMAMDTWFKGAVGKVAVYNRLLSQSEINSHYIAMTGAAPTGVCGDTCHF